MSALHRLRLPEVAVLLPDDHEVVHWWRTGGLPSTDDDLPVTGDQRVPPESLLAGADGAVVVDVTDRVLATRSYARVSAVIVEAGEADGTLAVVLALSLPAGDEWISLEARGTPALGGVPSWDALSVGSTRVGIAGVRLLSAAGDGVGGGDVALDTLAHGVTLEVDRALSVGAAGAGEARVGGWCPGLDPGTARDGVRLGGEARQAGAHRVALPVLIALSVGAAGTRVTRVRPGGAPDQATRQISWSESL